MLDKQSDSPEEQKRMTRRRLLKLGVYTIPIVTTIIALSDEAHAAKRCLPKCNPAQCLPS
ncbi:MAG: hypothetical protein ACE5KZ_07410 [Candidatus Scalinduaceae bacterium]